ncbi:serine proteinase inhibitor [Cooperia oncophora]
MNKLFKIEFMNDFNSYRAYAEDNDLQVLSLPYKDESYAFNIFLPKTRFGLNALRPRLTGARIQNLLSQLQIRSVTLTIPKMKIETDFKLKQALIAMGVTQMFTDNADLTGITKSPPLKISDATHRAIIEVDEEGTTAAAATVITAVGSGVPQPSVRFLADHPFLFILTKDNNPLFMGQFV